MLPSREAGNGQREPPALRDPAAPRREPQRGLWALGGSQPSTGFHGSFLGPLWRSLGPGFVRALLRAARWGLGGLEGGGIEAGSQAGASAPG